VTTPGVDFFRVDRTASTRRRLVTGVLMVSGGASGVGAHLVHRLPVDVSHLVSLVGGVCMAAGLVLTFGALAMVLFENVYLAIHEDHVLVHDSGRETKIPWDELTAIGVDAKNGYVELSRRKGKVLRWHAGKTASDVAHRIEEAKRKAAHGLLRMNP
jgi:hypothetical protein